MPAGAIAALALAALVVTKSGSEGTPLEASLADPGAFTYRDDSARTTLVWLSYPAENELADSEPSSKLP